MNLFDELPNNQRRPNSRQSVSAEDQMTRYELTGEQCACLRWNTPGKSGKMGGYQKLENWVIKELAKHPSYVDMDYEKRERLMRYIHSYGDGGPNERLRKAFASYFNVPKVK